MALSRCPALLCSALLISGMMPTRAEPQRLSFPYENKSDLRGVLNAFKLFEGACLLQPVSETLADALLPEGYRVVSSSMHMWGDETGAIKGMQVLSKTGSEEGDFAGGHPIIELRQPTEKNPDGTCVVRWQRAWDYEDGRDRISLAMAAQFDAWVSYYLEAILETKPDDGFSPSSTYSTVSEWRTPCWDRKICRFELLYTIGPDTPMIVRLRRFEAGKVQ